ncbi:hypothetical protein BYT27DRAFT_7229593 [Phlegmacium glaucopus]|nr:hypothetical protein BYT27DRAFT_7229593 [Phlegmacium glaucopus]
MELTLEVCRIIVKNVGNPTDIATLCRVSRSFRHVSEPALYKTIFMQNDNKTILLCNTLASSPRLSSLVDALAILLLGYEEHNDSGDSSDYDAEGTDLDLPDGYWTFVAKAMEKLVHLRSLSVHIDNGSKTSNAWILDNCTFHLQNFHCDFDWDEHLVRFLDRQLNLEYLYILDYKNMGNTVTPHCLEEHPQHTVLSDNSMPKLSILECTFAEAATAIVPNRPITHLKTCLSRSRMAEKREEMNQLLTKVKLSTRPLRSLDITASYYTEELSRQLLVAISSTRSTLAELRYLGTLVLPVDGRERLLFYGLLMRFPKIQCLELEVSAWELPPSPPAALRALASEMRLYIPSIIQVIFVQSFGSSVVTAINGICRLDTEINIDLLWRES